MTRRDKLIANIRNRPNAVRFEDACKIAESIGFRAKGGRGPHRTYGREGEPLLLHFQNVGGCIKPYQARQLLDMVEKYGNDATQVPD